MADYNPNYQQDYEQDDPAPQKSIRGYKIIIIILAVILAALAFLYFQQTNALKRDWAAERDELTIQLDTLRGQYGNLRIENDTITQNLAVQRFKLDSLREKMTQEQNLSRAKIRQYEKEVGTLRTVMRGFVQQIDSLNTLNKKLIDENVGMRRQVSEQTIRADRAEEKAQELNTKVRQGSVVRARDIALRTLSNSDRETTRARQAARMRVDFVLASNELAQPGGRNVYARIIGPDGYVMANASNALFQFEGDMITYSATREVDYQGQDLPVSLYYSGGGITEGQYQVEIYMDGHRIGRNEVILR